VTILSIKLAILLEWIRIFVPRGTKGFVYWASYALMWANIAFTLSVVVALNVSCTPYEFTWNKLMKGNCDRVNYKDTNLSASVFNFISDVLILLIPQRTIWNLNMQTRKKIGVSVVFAVGVFGCGAGLARVVETVKHAESPDFTYTFSNVVLWSGAEMTCGFLVICVPSFPKAFQAMDVSKLKGSLSFWTWGSSQRQLRSGSKELSGDVSNPASHSTKFRPGKANTNQSTVIEAHHLSSVPRLSHKDSSEQPLHPYEDMGKAEQGIIRTTQFETTETYLHSSNTSTDTHEHRQ
jgi:hypothetical protein